MNELERLLAAYDQIDFPRQQAALATVVKVHGSAYRRPGARMLITDDGRWTGAISGGCLEGDALRKARQVMMAGQARTLVYDTMDDQGAQSLGIGLGCNGIIHVLLEPLDAHDSGQHLAMLRSFVGHDAPELLATVFDVETDEALPPSASAPHIGERLMLKAGNLHLAHIGNQAFADQLLAHARQVLAQGKSQAVVLPFHPHGRAHVFFEVLLPPIGLLVFGGGYDVPPLVSQAKALGWTAHITDDCIAHLAPKRFPNADGITCVLRHQVAEHIEVGKLPMHGRTAAVLMSHNYKYDLEVLRQLLATPVPYIGILGPRKRTDKMLAELAAEGLALTEADLDRLHSPIGLDLGAETPEEIALAVVAEVLAHFNRRPATFLKHRHAPIHERA